MTPAEIASALGEPLPEVRDAITAASGLVIADDEERLSLVHALLVDALTDPTENPREARNRTLSQRVLTDWPELEALQHLRSQPATFLNCVEIAAPAG